MTDKSAPGLNKIAIHLCRKHFSETGLSESPRMDYVGYGWSSKCSTVSCSDEGNLYVLIDMKYDEWDGLKVRGSV